MDKETVRAFGLWGHGLGHTSFFELDEELRKEYLSEIGRLLGMVRSSPPRKTLESG